MYSSLRSPKLLVGAIGLCFLLIEACLYIDRQAKWIQEVDKSQTRSHGTIRPERVSVNTELNALRKNSFSIKFDEVDINNLTDDQILLTIHDYLVGTDVICDRIIRMGNMRDGGWDICDDPDVAPEPPCLIYSFGINNDFSFDDDAAKLYGCEVYSFDPSMNKSDYERSDRVHFRHIGIWGENTVNDRGWPLFTFNDIKRQMGHENKTIDVVKMDIEEAEMRALPEMIASGALQGVKQFYVEYHIWSYDRKSMIRTVNILRGLQRLGFRRFLSHRNPSCHYHAKYYPVEVTECYEVYYMYKPHSYHGKH